MIIIKNIIQILTYPKNTRMFLLGGIVVLFILLFRQCEKTNIAKGEAVKISKTKNRKILCFTLLHICAYV